MSEKAASELEAVLEAFPGCPILVVGDVILDEFVWGRVDRISPEAPVPVVEVERQSLHLGGAANVAANLRVLGAEPRLVGVAGQDPAAARLREELRRQGIEGRGVVAVEGRMTTVKTRIIAHHQQVCRTDRETRAPLPAETAARVLAAARQGLEECRAVILSDYSKGVLGEAVAVPLIEEARARGRFLAVDPKVGDFGLYRGASVITPNKKEAERAAGALIRDEATLLEVGRRLLEEARLEHLLITRGEEGMTLFSGESHWHIPTAAREVFDVTGAGDTVIAALTLAAAAGADIPSAAILANQAAGVVVGKLGTASATVAEIRAGLEAHLAG